MFEVVDMRIVQIRQSLESTESREPVNRGTFKLI